MTTCAIKDSEVIVIISQSPFSQTYLVHIYRKLISLCFLRYWSWQAQVICFVNLILLNKKCGRTRGVATMSPDSARPCHCLCVTIVRSFVLALVSSAFKLSQLAMPKVSTYMTTWIELLQKEGLHPAGIFKILKHEGLSVSFPSVARIVKKLQTTGSLANLPRSGRPSKSSTEAKAFIDQQMRKDDEMTSGQIQKKLKKRGITVSSSTVRRARKEQRTTNRLLSAYPRRQQGEEARNCTARFGKWWYFS